MPSVYYSHPMATINFIDVEQIGNWEDLPEGKLLAHPFRYEAKIFKNHQKIKADLFAAVEEITQSSTVDICFSHPCFLSRGTSMVFLIYNILELHCQMLLKHEVWSSMDFTFRVTTLNLACLDYLFRITELTTKSIQQV